MGIPGWSVAFVAVPQVRKIVSAFSKCARRFGLNLSGLSVPEVLEGIKEIQGESLTGRIGELNGIGEKRKKYEGKSGATAVSAQRHSSYKEAKPEKPSHAPCERISVNLEIFTDQKLYLS